MKVTGLGFRLTSVDVTATEDGIFMGPVSVDNICSRVQTDILVAAKNNFRQTKGLVNYKFSSPWWMEKWL